MSLNIGTILLLMAGSVLLLEIISGRHRNIHKKSDFLISGSYFLIFPLIRPFLALAAAWVVGLLMPVHKELLAGTSVVAGAVVLLLVGEFMQYWIHRWAHNPRRKLLYGLHRTHHSAKYVNLLVFYRVNVFWPLVHPTTWVGAVAFYLGMYEAGAVYFFCMAAWNIVTHSDLRWDDYLSERFSWGETFLKYFESIFITPRIHHTHHGYGRDGKTYRNFCTIFSFYDRMFGTLHIPKGRPQFYGLPGKDDPHWLEQLFFPVLGFKTMDKYVAKRGSPTK